MAEMGEYMARKRKKEKEFPGIEKTMDKIKETMDEIRAHQAEAKEMVGNEIEDKDYKYWTVRIIKSIEDNDKYDKEAYEELTKKYPQVKELVDKMISHYELYSAYDFESHRANFPLPAYFKQIRDLIENK
jgi:hypothetical protein